MARLTSDPFTWTAAIGAQRRPRMVTTIGWNSLEHRLQTRAGSRSYEYA